MPSLAGDRVTTGQGRTVTANTRHRPSSQLYITNKKSKEYSTSKPATTLATA